MRALTIRRPSLMALCLTLLVSSTALADPHIILSETLVEAGQIVLLQVRDFEPGGYEASIRFDGVEITTWFIPAGGDGDTFIQIPPPALRGAHDLEVCVQCGVMEFEQSATQRVTVTGGSLGAGDFNFQIQAIEVTQGTRGPIPARFPPGGSFSLPPEAAQHVANRRTVVRVYPWMDVGEGSPLRRFGTIVLTVNRGGTTYGPYFRSLYITADLSLNELRADPQHSAQFVLPEEAVGLAPGTGSFTLDFDAEVLTDVGEFNPGDNSASLSGVDFTHVGLTDYFAFRYRPYLVRHETVDGDGNPLQRDADFGDLTTALRAAQEILPIADGMRGIRLYPWRFIDWEGATRGPEGEELFDEAMFRLYLPTGRLDGNPVNDFYAFLFKADARCAGHAYPNTPYLVTKVCGRPVYTETHELTHAIGQEHAGNGHGEFAGGGFDPSYPGIHGQVEPDTYGYDVYNGLAFPPISSTVPEFARHDYMSYGPDAFISRYTWEYVASELGTPTIAARTEQPVASVTGQLTARRADTAYSLVTGSVDLAGQTFALSPVFAAPESQPQLPLASDLAIRFYDASSNLLLEHWTRVFYPRDELDSQGLVLDAVPFPFGWASIGVGEANLDWEVFPRSANPPVIQNFSLQSGFQWSGSPVLLTWDGFDPDDDPVTYRVIAVREGTEFHILATDLAESQFEVDPTQLPGGGTYDIFIEASDGLDSGFSNIATGWADPLSPRVLILNPEPGATVLQSATLGAVAMFADFQSDGPMGELQWTLDKVPVGTGTTLDLTDLDPGPHTLEATALNEYQQPGSASVDFFVIDALSSPVLQSPPDLAASLPDSIVLSWNEVAGATGYIVEIALDDAFTLTVVRDAGLVGPMFLFATSYPAVTYHWRVQGQGGGEFSGWSEIRSFTTAGISTGRLPALARSRLRLDATPNPFNPSTRFTFRMPHGGPARLTVYDLAGRLVRTLHTGTLPAGEHALPWDGHDDSGSRVASAVYIARLEALGMEDTRRVVLLK